MVVHLCIMGFDLSYFILFFQTLFLLVAKKNCSTLQPLDQNVLN